MDDSVHSGAAVNATAPFAVPMGDPAGIGPEIIAKAWMVRDAYKLPPFFVIGDEQAIRQVWQGPIAIIGSAEEAADHFGSALPCLQIDRVGDTEPGSPSVQSAHIALQALETGIGLAKAGSASALVTAPVAKSALYAIGFTHPGQTEFIAERCGIAPENAVMMLAAPGLRVVPVTIHMPLAQVPAALSIDLICARARITARGLYRQFGIESRASSLPVSIRMPERTACWDWRSARSLRLPLRCCGGKGWT